MNDTSRVTRPGTRPPAPPALPAGLPVGLPTKRGRSMTAEELYKRFNTEPLLKPSEVAMLFRVDPKTVVRWAEQGKLSYVRTAGGHRRFRESVVRAHFEAVHGYDAGWVL